MLIVPGETGVSWLEIGFHSEAGHAQRAMSLLAVVIGGAVLLMFVVLIGLVGVGHSSPTSTPATTDAPIACYPFCSR